MPRHWVHVPGSDQRDNLIIHTAANNPPTDFLSCSDYDPHIVIYIVVASRTGVQDMHSYICSQTVVSSSREGVLVATSASVCTCMSCLQDVDHQVGSRSHSGV